MDIATNLAKLGKTGYKLYNKYTSGTSILGGTGANAGLSSASVSGGAPAGFTGTATGEAFAGSAATGPGWGALGAGSAFFALAAFNAGKIYEGFTKDHPHLSFIGSDSKYLPGSIGGADGSNSYETAKAITPNHGGYPSRAGFDFVISAKDFEGAHEAAVKLRDYFDEVFTEIQGNTSVNINDVIRYANTDLNFKKGETPLEMATKLVNSTQEGIQTGKAIAPLYSKDGQYISSTKKQNTYDAGNEKFEQTYNSGSVKGRDLADAEQVINATKNVSGRDRADAMNVATNYLEPIYSDIPTFQGDANYEIQEFSPAINGSGSMANSTGFKKLKEVGEDIEYQQTLANLSGIKLSEDETKYLDEQRDIAIDRAMAEIEDTFGEQTGQLIAQQVYNLGGNALGGTIGQSFMKKWQEKEAKMKTDSLADIESMYLGTKEQRLSEKKQHQMDLWGMDYDKYKFDTGVNFQWDQNALDRSLQERIGNQEIEAWDESNKWTGLGSLAGSVVGSDWFGDWLTS